MTGAEISSAWRDEHRALLQLPVDFAERSDRIVAQLTELIQFSGLPAATAVVLEGLEQLGGAASGALRLLLDSGKPPEPLEPVLAAALARAKPPSADPVLARLVMRALIRWGDLAVAAEALAGLPNHIGPRPHSDHPDRAGWRSLASLVVLPRDQVLLYQAILHSRQGRPEASARDLKAVRQAGRPVQMEGVLLQLARLAASRGSDEVLGELHGVIALAPAGARKRLREALNELRAATEEEALRAEARKVLVQAILSPGPPQASATASLGRSLATAAKCVDERRRPRQSEWLPVAQGLDRFDAEATPTAIAEAEAFFHQMPDDGPWAHALIAALTRWGDLSAVRTVWAAVAESRRGATRPIDYDPSSGLQLERLLRRLGEVTSLPKPAERLALEATAALRLERLDEAEAAVHALAANGVAPEGRLPQYLATLAGVAEAKAHPAVDEALAWIEPWPAADVATALITARVERHEGVAKRLAARIADAEGLSVRHAMAVGDQLAQDGRAAEAFQAYRRPRLAGQHGGEPLSARLLNHLDSDGKLAGLMQHGQDAEVLDHLRSYLAPEMGAEAFEIRQVASPRDLCAPTGVYVEVMPAAQIESPHAVYAGTAPGPHTQLTRHPEVYGGELAEGQVVGGSAVVLAAGPALLDPVHAPNAHRYDHRDTAVVIATSGRVVLRLKPFGRRLECAVSLLGVGAGNYYHWMYDICSRLVGLQALPEPPPGAVLLVDEAPLGVPQMVQVLERLNRWNLPVQAVARGERIAVDRLRVASPAAWGPVHTRHDAGDLQAADCVVMPEAVMALRTLVSEELEPPPRRRRLLLSRKGLANARIQNEAEIERLLTGSYGFETVDPGQMSFVEQARCFASAEAIVGATGAAMTNLTFCSPGAKVFCLIADRYDYSTWPMIGQAVGAEVVYVAGRPLAASRYRYHAPYQVDLDRLEAALKQGGLDAGLAPPSPVPTGSPR